MKYLLLIRPHAGAEPPTHESDPEDWVECTTRTGQRLLGEQLRPASEATTVRVVGGDLLVADGPFAEAREQIAGFDVIEAASDAEAVEIAAAHPVATFGAVEVRAFWPFEGEE